MVLSPKSRPGVPTPFAITLLTRVVLPITRVLHRATLRGEELAVLGAAAILFFVRLAWPWRALLAWVFAGSPFALFPILPATIRIRIGAPP